MTERDVNFEGYTHEDDPYANERRAATFFGLAKEEARRLVIRRFDTSEAASSAGNKYVEKFSTLAVKTEGVSDTEMRVRGFNVRVSNVTTEQTEDGRFIVGIDPEMPYAIAPPYSEPLGVCDGLIVALDQDDDGYFTVPMARFVDAEPDHVALQVNQLSVADVHVTKYILAPLDDTEFTVPVLEGAERHQKALSSIALRHAEKPTKVTDALKSITVAVTQADDRLFTPFEQVESFHALSALPEDENVEQVLETFRGIMGEKRPVRMEAGVYLDMSAKEPLKTEITGTFIDIVPAQEALKLNEPVMVVSVVDHKRGEETLVYVPLRLIESFSF